MISPRNKSNPCSFSAQAPPRKQSPEQRPPLKKKKHKKIKKQKSEK